MKKLFIIIALGLVLFSSLAKADVYQYDIVAEIFSNNTVHYRLNFIFSENASQNITIPLGFPTNIHIESPNCMQQEGSLETAVICIPGESNSTNVTIEYNSNTINAKDSYSLFSDSFRIVDDTKTLSVLIKLPEGTGLKEPTESSYSPSRALISSDGRRLILNWVSNDLKAGDRFDVSIAFERISEASQLPFVLVIFTVLVTFSSLGLFYQFFWKSRNVKLILPVLKKDEKAIFDSIIKHGSGVNQKTIVKDSGYSKAKVSKVLNSLKERRLVKLERIGRSNKVHIEKNFEKKS